MTTQAFTVKDVCTDTYHKLRDAKQLYVDIQHTIRQLKRTTDITTIYIVNHAHENEECDLVGKKLSDAAMHIIKDTLLEEYELRLSEAQDNIKKLTQQLDLNPHPKTK